MNGFDKPVVREDNTEGLVYFAWEELEGLTEGGSVLDVTFKVLEAAETGEELAVKFANGTDGGEETVIGSFSGIDSDGEPEYAPMEAETTNGVITATKVILLGDVNQDGFLDFSDLQRLFMHLSGGELLTGDGLAVANTQKRCPFYHRGLECKSRKSRNTWNNRQFGLGVQNEAGQRLTEFCQENALIIANTLFQQQRR